ncbi:MAG TPA: hypothetical protein VFV60_05885 [bacterium]|nr:hypothetical protein [bacterium]
MDIRRAVVAGVIASVVMGMIEMIYEAAAGDGFWSPLIFIGATVLRRLQSVQIPVRFDLWGVVLGLMGHMMNSVILGLVFAAIFSRSAMSHGSRTVAGAGYALVIFFVMWYLVVPAVDRVMLNLNATVFGIAHLMWGAVLGWFGPSAKPMM